MLNWKPFLWELFEGLDALSSFIFHEALFQYSERARQVTDLEQSGVSSCTIVSIFKVKMFSFLHTKYFCVSA